MKNLPLPIVLLILTVALSSCKAVDLRPKALQKQAIEEAEEKGRELLAASKKAMGYDLMEKTKVYQAKAFFDWKGLWLAMPMNTFPGNNKKEVLLRLATNSFDGQLTYLEGRKKGEVQGIQSWQGYKTKVGSDRIRRHEHHRYLWGLATYHYLIEAPMHFSKAEIVRYAGKKRLDDVTYELVYISWGTEAPNKEYDRMLVYLHPETKFMTLMEVTINDYFIPMPRGLQHATARFERNKTRIGTYLPSKVTIQFKSPKPEQQSVYDFSLREYEFDNFELEQLYPLKGLPYYGLSKPAK